jgi:hypothetical protein
MARFPHFIGKDEAGVPPPSLGLTHSFLTLTVEIRSRAGHEIREAGLTISVKKLLPF